MVKVHSGTRHKIDKKLILQETEAILVRKELSNYLVNIIFVGKRKMLEIANTYKHENVALPVLSFTYKEDVIASDERSNPPESAASPLAPRNDNELEENLLGEIFICYPQAILLAAEREKSVDKTLMQLIEHGIENLIK